MMRRRRPVGERLPLPPADPPPARGRRRFALAALLVLGAALYLRLCGAARAFVGSELVPPEGDALYHLRRMRLLAASFPHVPWVDPLIAWPSAAPVPWAAGFDFMGALALRFGRATGGELGADLWVGALPALLGLAVVGATMELVHTLADGLAARRGATLAAGLLAACIPQGLAVSRFGYVDHHVAEALAMILLLRWAVGALPPRTEASAGRRLARELAGGAVSGWAVWVFTGSPLYVALVVPILLAAALLSPRPRLLGSGGPGLLLGAALAALASAPAVAAHGRALAFGFPSWLQPLLLGAAGAALCVAAVAGARFAPGARRAGALAAATLAIAVAVALAAPSGAAQAAAALREWLFKTDPWIAGIDEFRPLLRVPGGPYAALGAAAFAAPLALPLGAAALLPRSRPRALAFLGVSTTLALLTLLQARFGRVFVPVLAASGGLALAFTAERLPRLPRWAASALPALAALALAVLDPRVRDTAFPAPDPVPDGAVEAALDLRGRAPGPSPGVLAPWDLGHQLVALAGRPVMTTGFGPYPDPEAYDEATRAFTLSERELLPLLERRRAGWVVAGAANLYGRVRGPTAPIPFAGRALSSRWLAEVPSAPLLLGGSGVPALGVRHFGHLMPVFASARTVGGLAGALPVLWTYQVVAGARLHGRAAPGTRVVLEVPLTEHGRAHAWRAFADADAEGTWSMTVPVPTDLASPALSSGPARLVLSPGVDRTVRISEADVRAGRDLEVPADAG